MLNYTPNIKQNQNSQCLKVVFHVSFEYLRAIPLRSHDVALMPYIRHGWVCGGCSRELAVVSTLYICTSTPASLEGPTKLCPELKMMTSEAYCEKQLRFIRIV